MSERNEIIKIVKKFKSKNGVPLFAYIGTWHGAKKNEEVKYIEREDDREYISSWEDQPKHSWDKTLRQRMIELKKTLILKYFQKYDLSSKKGYVLRAYGKRFNKKLILEELKLLIKEKQEIYFNEDHGVGQLHYKGKKYLVELNVYLKQSFPVRSRDLNKAIIWIWVFCTNRKAPGFDYGKGLSAAFSKDFMTPKSRKQMTIDYKRQVNSLFRSF